MITVMISCNSNNRGNDGTYQPKLFHEYLMHNHIYIYTFTRKNRDTLLCKAIYKTEDLLDNDAP